MRAHEVYRRWQTVKRRRIDLERTDPKAPALKRLRNLEAALHAQALQISYVQARRAKRRARKAADFA